MGAVDILLTLAAAGFIGCLIGGVGIGGVLLVPFLTYALGLPVREAVAIAMASYIATGIAAIMQARMTDDWRQLRPYWLLIVATLPGAFLGGLAIGAIPDRVALLLLAIFLVLTGLWWVLRDRLPARDGTRPSGWPTGILSGFASALTGTGGPAVLMPVLMWRGTPLLAAIALGQIVQLPIAVAATAGNLASGPIHLGVTAVVAVGLVPGVVAGRAIARRLPIVLLGRAVAILLVATGLLLVMRAVG